LGLGFGFQGLGFEVQVFRFSFSGLGWRVEGFGVRVQGLRFMLSFQLSGFRV
jgi:hypothetical protein